MNNVIRIATVLSWINLVVWGLLCGLGLLSAVASGNLAFILGFFLLSSIALHSYAALQLHKSIRNPAIPLGAQTPAGIRFVGLVALLFGVLYLAYAMALLQRPGDILQMLQSSMPQFKDVRVQTLRAGGTIALLLGLSITINVILNFRLLRWYYMSRDSSDKGGNS